MSQRIRALADDCITSLRDVEELVGELMRTLHHETGITFHEASDAFTRLHAHAAWTEVEPLATLADRIWGSLDNRASEDVMAADDRVELSKLLVTYKFLLHRFCAERQAPAA